MSEGEAGCGKREEVKEYYGKILQKSSDLKTSVCTTPVSQGNDDFRKLIKEIHPDVIDRYYGCGIPIPDCLAGTRILDLGSGSGRDCFMLSKLVGPNGAVTGIDMTNEQVEYSKTYVPYHTDKFGYLSPNVTFVTGYIEDLKSAGMQSEQFDLAISNCVINLSPDKEAVLKEVYRVLKIGGEFYFSDIYSNKKFNEEQQKDKVLWGECISGALWWEDFIKMSIACGFSEPRLVESHYIDITNEALKPLIGDVKFVSATFRLLKLPKSIATAGNVAYLGSIEGRPNTLLFDQSISFKVNELQSVDAPTMAFLSSSRYCQHFKFVPNDVSAENLPKNKVDPFKLLDKCHSSKKSCCC